MRPRRAALPVAFAALLAGLAGAVRPARAGETVELQGPEAVEGLLRADATGDGVTDLLLLEGREVYLYEGRREGLPAPTPTRRIRLPADAGYVDAAPPAAPGGAGLLALGPTGLFHVPVDGGPATAVAGAAALPSWTDSHRAAFVGFVEEDGTVLLPTPAGVQMLGPGPAGPTATLFPCDPFHELTPAGPFLEDTLRIVVGHPRLLRGAPPRAAPPGTPGLRWALAGRELVGFLGERHVTYDVGFLPPAGVRRLLDIDGDGVPDLLHHQGSNRDGTYAFFRTPAAALVDGQLARTREDLRPPASVLRLEGFQLEPELVDLDGDGRLDFVVTTIPIDARNTALALRGRVNASTLAFLNREGGEMFPRWPDATVESSIGVAIRLTPGGNIDVKRSFTILADADLDGDRRNELVIRTGPEALTVRRGVPKGVWEAEGREVAIPPVGSSPNVEGFSADLSGDGKDELVLLYRRPARGRDVVRVLRP